MTMILPSDPVRQYTFMVTDQARNVKDLIYDDIHDDMIILGQLT